MCSPLNNAPQTEIFALGTLNQFKEQYIILNFYLNTATVYKIHLHSYYAVERYKDIMYNIPYALNL